MCRAHTNEFVMRKYLNHGQKKYAIFLLQLQPTAIATAQMTKISAIHKTPTYIRFTRTHILSFFHPTIVVR